MNSGRLIAKGHSKYIRIQYDYNEFKGIPSQDFAAYWVGWLNIPEAGEYEFAPKHAWAGVRITLDGRRVYEGYNQSDSSTVQLEPGRYRLEVELTNYWHTTDFALTVNQLK